jgi:hypothetical protein
MEKQYTFLLMLEKNSIDIYKILQKIYGQGTVSRTQIFGRVKCLQDGKEGIR